MDMDEYVFEYSYSDVSNVCVERLAQDHDELTTLAAYQTCSVPSINSRIVVNGFETISSCLGKHVNGCHKRGVCFSDQYANMSSKASNCIAKYREIDNRISAIKELNVVERGSGRYPNLNLNERLKFMRNKIKHLTSGSIETFRRNQAELVSHAEITKQKIENLESLIEQIENHRHHLESVNELSQRFERSSLSDDDIVVTQEDLVKANGVLEKMLSIEEDNTKQLEDLCKEANISLEDVDNVVPQTTSGCSQEDKSLDNEIEELRSEIVQLLSEKISEMKKELEYKRNLLAEKKDEEIDLEEKYKSLLDEIESFDF
uniref:Viral A-type inclusion protein n=1 Tax=Strongyloides papillosus TaxID=174720 RepID=A0A0N5B679_STREA